MSEPSSKTPRRLGSYPQGRKGGEGKLLRLGGCGVLSRKSWLQEMDRLFFQSIWRSKKVREATSTMKIRKQKNEMLKDGKTGLGDRAWRSPEQSLEALLDAEMVLEVTSEPPGSWLGKQRMQPVYLGWLPLPQREQLCCEFPPVFRVCCGWALEGTLTHTAEAGMLSMLSTPAQRRGKIGHWNKRGSMLRAPRSPQYW